MQASGGNLTLQNGVFTGGTYSASVGTLRLNGAFIEGGAAQPAINVASGATLAGNGAILLGTGASFTNRGVITADTAGSTLMINGGGQTWANAGTIESTGGILNLSNGVFQGGTFAAQSGTFQLGATIGASAGAPVTVTTSPGGTITGYVNGQILLAAGDHFFNNGTITTTLGNLTLDGGGQSWNNAGTIQASAGVMTLRNGTFQGGVYNSSGGTMALSNAVIQGNGATPATVTIAGTLEAVAGANTINLTAGHFTNTGLVETLGGSLILAGSGGALNNVGTLLASGGLLSLNGTWNNAGSIQASSEAGAVQISGTMNNSGSITIINQGEVQLNGALNNSGTVVVGANSVLLAGASDIVSQAQGSILITGGTLEAAGTVTNEKGATIRGSGTLAAGAWNNFGEIDFSLGDTTVFGSMNNEGTIANTGGTVHFMSGFTDDGAYLSDPSDNYFETLTIGSQGYLAGGPGDEFLIDGDFLNSSTQQALWDTTQAEIDFLTGGVHQFHAVAGDLGSANDNAGFTWGTLHVGAGQTIDFTGGPGAAQYFGLLELDGGLSSLSELHSDGVNIYYVAANAGNAYLGGQSYALSGGGEPLPFATPEPGSAAMFGFAIGLLICAVKLRGARSHGQFSASL